MVFGKVKESTIYVKYVERSCKKAFKKNIVPWSTEHDGVINITPTRGRHFLLGSGAADYSYATEYIIKTKDLKKTLPHCYRSMKLGAQ